MHDISGKWENSNSFDFLEGKNMQQDRLKISDIKFGKIDAHNELQELGEEFYLDSFLEYDNTRYLVS